LYNETLSTRTLKNQVYLIDGTGIWKSRRRRITPKICSSSGEGWG
jgi:hypothetical protein